MKKTVHHILAACLGSSLAWTAFADAPVVDESENFALFDEQLAAAEQQPVAFMQEEIDLASADEDNSHVALAREDNSSDTHQDATDMFSKMQSLQQELSELRGQLEVQTHALQSLKQQQLDFYKDLDARLRESGNSNNAPTPIANKQAKNTQQPIDSLPESTVPRGNPADEQVSYLAAYELIKNKEFDKALMAMKSFINHYPRGGYTANAHYWLGELYMTKKAYPDAIQQFETVLSSFPSSSKSAASSLKLGYALAESGQKDSAREHLKAVIRNYPDTRAAQLAASKLESIRS